MVGAKDHSADLRASLASATTLRRGDQLTVLYVAALSIGLYLLLEGPAPMRISYPARHPINV